MSGRILFALIILFALTGVGATYLVPKYQKNRVEQEKLHDYRIKNEQDELKLEQVRKEIEALKSSPRAVSKVAREKFGFCKPGEQVFHFIDLEDKKNQ